MATVFSQELVVVYTMGKVASTTISSSLLDSGVNCADVHVMSKPALRSAIQVAYETGKFPPPHVGDSLRIRRDFYKKRRNVKIISLVRDCPSRLVSLVFQNLRRDTDYSVDDINSRISGFNPGQGSDWFSREFFGATEVDVFAEPFDVDKKYAVYNQPGMDILLMRVDLNDNKKEQIISEFLGKPISIAHANVSANKWYGDLHNEFKLKGKIKPEWFELLKGTQILNHFYSADEREQALASIRKLVL